jgi:hypothetical protein
LALAPVLCRPYLGATNEQLCPLGDGLKYAYLLRDEEVMLEAPPKREFDVLVAEALADDGVPRKATTTRTRNGKRPVTDGPFAETKEHLGGSS